MPNSPSIHRSGVRYRDGATGSRLSRLEILVLQPDLRFPFFFFSRKVIGLSTGLTFFGQFRIELAVYLAVVWIAVYGLLSSKVLVLGKASGT